MQFMLYVLSWGIGGLGLQPLAHPHLLPRHCHEAHFTVYGSEADAAAAVVDSDVVTVLCWHGRLTGLVLVLAAAAAVDARLQRLHYEHRQNGRMRQQRQADNDFLDVRITSVYAFFLTILFVRLIIASACTRLFS